MRWGCERCTGAQTHLRSTPVGSHCKEWEEKTAEKWHQQSWRVKLHLRLCNLTFLSLITVFQHSDCIVSATEVTRLKAVTKSIYSLCGYEVLNKYMCSNKDVCSNPAFVSFGGDVVGPVLVNSHTTVSQEAGGRRRCMCELVGAENTVSCLFPSWVTSGMFVEISLKLYDSEASRF